MSSKKRGIKYNTVYIGFYGGEPLLEFNLIKDTVNYAKEQAAKKSIDKFYDVKFRLTTNGYLLNKKEIDDFLLTNDIGIDVSLDGPKEEHDKFRVTANMEASWEVIWKNLDDIYNKYPD